MEKVSIYWAIRDGIDVSRQKLLAYKKEDLVHLLLNTRYNDFVRQFADFEPGEKPQEPEIANGFPYGKRIPYIGWFWRNCDFARREISIGDCGGFIGFMVNNKWNYPERLLKTAEVNEILKIIESAMRGDEKGGIAAEIDKNTKKELEKLWEYMQTLKI